MSERYLFTDPKLPGLSNFANYKGALRALCLADDPWATRPAVGLLCSGFIVDRARDPDRHACRRRRGQDRPFRILSPRAPRHAVAGCRGMDPRRRSSRHDAKPIVPGSSKAKSGNERQANPDCAFAPSGLQLQFSNRNCRVGKGAFAPCPPFFPRIQATSNVGISLMFSPSSCWA